MKKYLMTGVAALALCVSFTNCSNNDFETMTQAQIDKAAYDRAFLNYVGGTIAKDQTWGFGDATSRAVTRAMGDYSQYKGSTTPMESYQDQQDGWKWKTRPYTFPSDCAASMFNPDLTGVKSYKEVADAANQGGGFATAVCYIDESYTGKVHIWGGQERAKLYFKAGNYDFTDRYFDLCQNADLYLLDGATLTLNNSAASTAKFDIYIASTAKLIANGNDGLRMENGAKLYNHGTIETKRFQVNNNSMLYNVGTLKTEYGVYAANDVSIIVNDGTIISGAAGNSKGLLHTAGSSRVQNNAEWTVYGNTIIDSNNNMWVNNGHFTTTNFCYTAASTNVINNCFLEVTEDFDINLSGGQGSSGCFTIDGKGGVLTKNFNGGGNFSLTYLDYYGNPATKSHNGGPFEIRMGAKSVFRVTNVATMNGQNPGNGFFGIGNDYAVLDANKIVAGSANQNGLVTYSGKMYVSAQEHFAQGNDGDPTHLFVYCKEGCTEANIFAPGFEGYEVGVPSDFVITTTPCNPGFNSIEKAIRIIAEDLSAKESGDFDFNDIVLDVEFGTNAILTLQAAGGTLPLCINLNEEWEVHKLFGVEEKVMVNTFAGKHHEYEPVVWESGISIKNAAEANEKLKLYVLKNGEWQEMTAVKSEPAAKLAVGLDFEWLDERQSIKESYPKFLDWAAAKPFMSKWW